MGTCPVCGREWECPGIKLCGSLAVTDIGTALLSPVQTTIVRSLFSAPMSKARLIEAIYSGPGGPPLSVSNCISVSLGNLRKKLNPIGYTVVNTHPRDWGGAVYALRPLYGEDPTEAK